MSSSSDCVFRMSARHMSIQASISPSAASSSSMPKYRRLTSTEINSDPAPHPMSAIVKPFGRRTARALPVAVSTMEAANMTAIFATSERCGTSATAKHAAPRNTSTAAMTPIA